MKKKISRETECHTKGGFAGAIKTSFVIEKECHEKPKGGGLKIGKIGNEAGGAFAIKKHHHGGNRKYPSGDEGWNKPEYKAPSCQKPDEDIVII